METQIARFTVRILIACFVALMAFGPGTLFAGDSEKKTDGKDNVQTTSTSEQGKKDTMKPSDKKEKEDSGAKKGGK